MQIKEIEEHDAYPDLEIIVGIYKNRLRKCIKDAFPFEDFRIESIGDCHYSITISKIIHKEEKKRKRFKKTIEDFTEEKELAKFEFISDTAIRIPRSKFGLSIELYDPIILHICGKTMKELKSEFEKHNQNHYVKYHYSIQQDDVESKLLEGISAAINEEGVEGFIEYFSKIKEKEKKIILKRMINHNFTDKEIIKWLDEHEAKLIREVGLSSG